MRNAATELVKLLAERGLTVTTAESCTGGLVSAAITAVPGASSVLDGAIVTYAASVKGRFLNIDPTILYEIGVVSAECAKAMAKGAAELFAADCSIALTGYAGPGGGDVENPTGTVYIAVNVLGTITVLKYYRDGTRDEVREGAATAALRLLGEKIREIMG
jgi:PncC family amidohydrolase